MTSKGFMDVKGKNLIMCITSCVLFVSQIVMALFLTLGMVDYYGSPVTALGAIELSLSVLNISVGAIFEYLLKLAIGIIYIVCLVYAIKNVIASISFFNKAAFSKAGENKKQKDDAFCALFAYVGETLGKSLLFIAFCVMTSVDFSISTGGIVTIILGVICLVGWCAVSSYFKGFKLDIIIYRTVTTAILAVAYVILLAELQIASIEQGISGLRVVFGGFLGTISTKVIFSLISLIAVPILYIVLQAFACSFISDIWSVDFYRSTKLANYSAGKIMGMAIAIASTQLLVSVILNSTQIAGISQLFEIIKNIVPVLLASIAIFVCQKVEECVEKAKEEPAPTTNKEPEVVVKKEAPAPEEVAVATEEKVVVATEEKVVVAEEKKPEQEDIFVELKKYKELLDCGIITQSEFDAKKKALLNL